MQTCSSKPTMSHPKYSTTFNQHRTENKKIPYLKTVLNTKPVKISKQEEKIQKSIQNRVSTIQQQKSQQKENEARLEIQRQQQKQLELQKQAQKEQEAQLELQRQAREQKEQEIKKRQQLEIQRKQQQQHLELHKQEQRRLALQIHQKQMMELQKQKTNSLPNISPMTNISMVEPAVPITTSVLPKKGCGCGKKPT